MKDNYRKTNATVFFSSESAACICPPGFEIVMNQCRGFYGVVENLQWVEAPATAIAKCKETRSQPVIIHNDEQNSYWASKAIDGGHPLVMGLMCNTNTKVWEWADGSAVDYKAKTHLSGLDQPCTTGFSWEVMHDGSWDGSGSNTGKFPTYIYCTSPLHQPVRNEDGCDSFEDDSDDGVCYQVGAAAESWEDAQMICRKLGANLASIHSQQENSFVRRLAVSKGAVDGLFLGASISGKGNDFGWVDGSEWDYNNFFPGFPIPGFGDCLAMDTSTSTGQWMNMACSAKLPVACVRDQKAVTDPTCNPGPSEEGKLITSPGFPYSASTPCDFFLSAEEGKLVELEIVLLEANPCCDFLVLHDAILGGNVIGNLTGEVRNATYTSSSNFMRVSWQPNGAEGVVGLAMTFRGV